MKNIIIILIFLSLSPMLLGVSFGFFIGQLICTLIKKEKFELSLKDFFYINEINRLWK